MLTVAVSVAAGSDALASTFSGLAPYKLFIALGFVALIAYGNLRGTKESGRLFAAPTYFFILNMLLMLGVGLYRELTGGLTQVHYVDSNGLESLGHASGNGLLMGVGLLVVLKAFGSGGATVTGVEAISNGVPAFRAPAWKNARDTLVLMGALLGVMFLGLSMLAWKTHVRPYDGGVPSVLSQVARHVYGGGTVGHALFLALQAGTMLILVLAANTSFSRTSLALRRSMLATISCRANSWFTVTDWCSQRDHLPCSRCRRHIARRGRGGLSPDTALCDRRIHQLHAEPSRNGETSLDLA